MARLLILAAMFICAPAFSAEPPAPPADAVSGAAEKAETIAKLEAELADTTARKKEAAKDDNRQKVKELTDSLNRLRLQISKAKSKTPNQYVEEAAERARVEAENTRLAAEKKKEDAERERLWPQKDRGKWYEGGTLHQRNGLAWQSGSDSDRLATCADFVATAHSQGLLKDSISRNISSMDDMRKYAGELRDCLDKSFAPEPNPDDNAKLHANQKVSELAAMCMKLMGWLK